MNAPVPTELETLFPEKLEVPIRGEANLVLEPLSVTQAAKVTKAVRRLIAAGAGELSATTLMLDYPEEVAQIVAVAAGRTEEWFGKLRADDGLRVATAVFAINVPFFVNVVAPMLAELASTLTGLAGQDVSSALLTGATKSPGTTQ